MKLRGIHAVCAAVAIVVAVTLALPATSVAQERRHADGRTGQLPEAAEAERLGDILYAQELYELVLSLGRGGPQTGPYLAPLRNKPDGTPDGDLYLWGGLDPISIMDRFNEDIATDSGGVIFISNGGSNLGKTTFSHDVSTYVAGVPTSVKALFKTGPNRTRYLSMTTPGCLQRDGCLVITFGMNCQYGIIAGPVSKGATHSHWAQPGLASIAVERFFGGRVTVLGVNLYSRGDDWNAIDKRWKYAIEAFESLLNDPTEVWERKRAGMPVLNLK